MTLYLDSARQRRVFHIFILIVCFLISDPRSVWAATPSDSTDRSLDGLASALGLDTASAVLSPVRIMRTMLDLELDSTFAYKVEGGFLTDGPATLQLESGLLYVTKVSAGRRFAAVFIGTGMAKFEPTLKEERYQMLRFVDAENYVTTFLRCVIFSTDATVSDLMTGVEKVPAGDMNTPTKIWHDAREGLFGTYDRPGIDPQLIRVLSNGGNEKAFRWVIHAKGEHSGIIVREPFEDNSYSFLRFASSDDPSDAIPIVECPPAGQSDNTHSSGVGRSDLLAVISHKLNTRIERSNEMFVTDDVVAVLQYDSLNWLDFYISTSLDIDSLYVNGDLVKPAHFGRKPDEVGGGFYVPVPKGAKAGDTLQMRFVYKGTVIRRIRDYTLLTSSILWYPQHGSRQLSRFHLTFTHPPSMTLKSVGDMISSKEIDDDHITSTWQPSYPIRNASFNIGIYKERKLDAKEDVPTSSIYYVTSAGIDNVSISVSQALEFYTKLYGKLPVSHIYATEMLGYHGEAFPGLIHLSDEAFANFTDAFFQEQFTAHEISHQWWGIACDYDSPRDRWISEGFAEYSALMYTQLASTSKSKFFDLLDKYRNDIYGRGAGTIGKKQLPPCVRLGHRVSIGGENNDYNNFVYYKGAWTLHMLRNMLIDLSTFNEDKFMSAMREIYAKGRTQRMSTDTVRAVFERYAGFRLDWFFDQWLYRGELPEYTFAWKKEKQQDGTWKVTMRVRQSGVPPSFFMIVPITVKFDDKPPVRFRINMTGEQAIMEMPPLPDEPDEIIFNDFRSVLCKVSTESF
ncbi:MAG TPA: M1 family aminopeptidase [Chlorobiota bacterium]|nr:M1 family aminopeptidase [Chlorobiota bacterium]